MSSRHHRYAAIALAFAAMLLMTASTVGAGLESPAPQEPAPSTPRVPASLEPGRPTVEAFQDLPFPPADAAIEGLPAAAITEEVEPGVLRVISDGHRKLSRERKDDDVFVWGKWTHEDRQIAAAPDGSVWMLDGGRDGGRMFKVGKKRTYGLKRVAPAKPHDDVEVAPDGTVWRVANRRNWPPSLRSFKGKRWTDNGPDGVALCGVEVQPNGIVWAAWMHPFGVDPEGCVIDTLGRWDGKRWKVIDTPKLWPSYGHQFAVTGNNEVWLCCKDKSWTEKKQRLVRYDGRKFKVMKDPAPQQERIVAPLLIDGSADGTLWIRRSSSTLARHDKTGWTVFTAADDGVPQMGWVPDSTGGFIRAAPDGSVWVSTTTDPEPPEDWPPLCDGVSRFDGTIWSHYLAGMCIFAIDITPDGTAWVQAALADTATSAEPVVGDPVEPIQTFVIQPQARPDDVDAAVATTQAMRGPLAVIDDPAEGGLDAAGGTGRLIISDRCVFLRAANGFRTALIWRDGQTVWDPDRHQIVFRDPDLGEIRLSHGDGISLGGGSMDEGPYAGPSGPMWLAEPDASCPSTEWVVHQVDFVDE